MAARRKKKPKKKVVCRKVRKTVRGKKRTVKVCAPPRRKAAPGRRPTRPAVTPTAPVVALPPDPVPPAAPAPSAVPAVPDVAVPVPAPPPPGATADVASPAALPDDPLNRAQVERLLWRAGFGPRPGDLERLTGRRLREVVHELTRPSSPQTFTGAPPRDDDGLPLAPADAWGHDHLHWLDRMVRADQPLVERMALIWHDWFATSLDGVGQQQLMLDHVALLRRHALGDFGDLLRDVTKDPAMLLWLGGTDNTRWNPNENYARELMELFSLGADRGAYSEADVREMARALTGWRADWTAERGPHNFRFDAGRHVSGTKTVFGRTGAWTWEDAVRLCLEHPLHPSFFVRKLWDAFVPTAPSAGTQATLERLYVAEGRAIRPVVEAILMHPDLLGGEPMVVPPVVHNAALLRMTGRGVDTESWAWLARRTGQRLFLPPNVAGWDDSRWLSTSTVRGRWWVANYVVGARYINPWPSTGTAAVDPAETPEQAVDAALAFWGRPSIGDTCRAALLEFARTALPSPMASWQAHPSVAQRQNALRVLLATAPEMQVR